MLSCLLTINVKTKIFKTMALLVVLYGYETWSFILSDEQRLMVFENRMLTIMFGPKRVKLT